MSAELEEKKKSAAGTTSPVLKIILIALFLQTSIAGYALLFLLPASLFEKALSPAKFAKTKKASSDLFTIKEIPTLLNKTMSRHAPDISISFNGVLLGETGTVAIVNGEMVVPGAEIEKDIRIIEITNRTLTLQYKDQIQNMTIGETVILNR